MGFVGTQLDEVQWEAATEPLSECLQTHQMRPALMTSSATLNSACYANSWLQITTSVQRKVASARRQLGKAAKLCRPCVRQCKSLTELRQTLASFEQCHVHLTQGQPQICKDASRAQNARAMALQPSAQSARTTTTCVPP